MAQPPTLQNGPSAYVEDEPSNRLTIYKKAELSQRWPRDAPYTWCPGNFRECLSTPTATFPEICNGLLFRSILWMCVQNLKFVALPLLEIIWGTQKLGSPICPFSLFSKIFNGLLFGWTLWIYQPNLKSVALPVPEIITIDFLGVGNPNLGEEEAIGVGVVTVLKSVSEFIGLP